MSKRLVHKKALVTGSAQGIGFAIAKRLASDGAEVILSDIDKDQLTVKSKELNDLGYKTSYVLLDVTNTDQIKSVAKYHALDILVNNAGIANDKKAENHSNEDWQKMMDLNLNGVFYCCRDFGNSMLERKSGCIINIASIAGVAVVSPEHHIGYDVAKAGIIQMTKTLGVNWAPNGIRVNSVSPGYTNTTILEEVGSESPETLEQWKSQIPNHSFNEPEEIAAVVAFLASNEASAINATNVMADGGYSVSQ
ncbi:SDR family oxidoreductase [Gangjinia marincola]|uniref:SDR family oxidoreductase n=1 Tax=Gangjinia marincola TaxID=578463 RepID=A0ABN1MEY0_9FLAO